MSKKDDFEQELKRFRNVVIHRDPGAWKNILVDNYFEHWVRIITYKMTHTENLEFMESEANPNTSSVESKPVPPINAEFILHIFLKRDELDAVLGDLLEKYAKKCVRFGRRRAKLWFYSEVLRSLWPLLKRFVAKAGGLIALGEWIRRHVS